MLSALAKRWDVVVVGAGMVIGFAVIILKLIGFF
jgi:hypothetical protein